MGRVGCSWCGCWWWAGVLMVRMLAVGALVVGKGAAAVNSSIRPKISSTYAFSFISQLQTGQGAAVWLQSLNLPPLDMPL